MTDPKIPSECDILRATLLPPSSLPAVISLEDFTSLFPADLQGHAQVPALYRALQHQRALDLDSVRENINLEAKRGDKQEQELLRSKIRGAGGAESLDISDAGEKTDTAQEQVATMDGVLYSHHTASAYAAHTLSTILPALDKAIASMQDEVSELEAAADQLQTQLEVSIGDLSDLRYGKLSRPSMRKEIIEALKSLAEECDSKGSGHVEL